MKVEESIQEDVCWITNVLRSSWGTCFFLEPFLPLELPVNAVKASGVVFLHEKEEVWSASTLDPYLLDFGNTDYGAGGRKIFSRFFRFLIMLFLGLSTPISTISSAVSPWVTLERRCWTFVLLERLFFNKKTVVIASSKWKESFWFFGKYQPGVPDESKYFYDPRVPFKTVQDLQRVKSSCQ